MLYLYFVLVATLWYLVFKVLTRCKGKSFIWVNGFMTIKVEGVVVNQDLSIIAEYFHALCELNPLYYDRVLLKKIDFCFCKFSSKRKDEIGSDGGSINSVFGKTYRVNISSDYIKEKKLTSKAIAGMLYHGYVHCFLKEHYGFVDFNHEDVIWNRVTII